MTEYPMPPVPHDLDLRLFPDMPLGVARLRDSESATIMSDKAFRAAVLLWCAAWHQVPASSLPTDDVLLAKYAGFGNNVKGWLKVKAEAMRNFIICADGRFYHPTIAEKATDSDNRRRAFRERTAAATEARKKRQRNDQRNDVQRDNVTTTKGREGKGREEERVVVEEARGASKLTDAAFSLSESLRTALGWDKDENAPIADVYTAQKWLNGHWDPEMCLETAKRVAAKTRSKIRSLTFFEPAIAEAHAKFVSPLPVAQIDPQKTITVRPNVENHRSASAGADRVLERLKSFDVAAQADGPDYSG